MSNIIIKLVLLFILYSTGHHHVAFAVLDDEDNDDNRHSQISMNTLRQDTDDDNNSFNINAPLDDYYLSIPIEFKDSDGRVIHDSYNYMRGSLTSHNFYQSIAQYCNIYDVIPTDCRVFAKMILGYIASIESVGYDDLIEYTDDFTQFGLKYRTDKITHHGYQRYYPRFIEQYRSLGSKVDGDGDNDNQSYHRFIKDSGSDGSRGDGSRNASSRYAMLEIGIARGKSLLLWLDYFPHAFIYGIDKDIDSIGDRYHIIKADQSDMGEMKSIFNHSNNNNNNTSSVIQHDHLFLIIDDGSHIPEHQINTFDYLFNRVLAYGGCYIIEDIETSYWTKEGVYGYPTRYGYHHNKSIIEIFKHLIDDINAECLTNMNKDLQDEIIDNRISSMTRQLISTITFGHNCIIIMKKTESEMKYNNRRYRFTHHL